MRYSDTLAPIAVRARGLLPSRWDAIAAFLLLGLFLALADTGHGVEQPLSALKTTPISLSPWHLPEYAARTTMRMVVAMVLSLLFTFTYATLAARSRTAERVLIPLLDILQSVPILGFISVTVVFFMSLAPGRVLGAEFAAVFAIFTSQAWNMAFSFYQSLRTVPAELSEAARCFHLSRWARFWGLDVPFAMPQLIWNMMMSMSGGWFFVVASEAITVGNHSVALPGIGSYIAAAIEARDLSAIGWAILTMLVVILVYDQLLFRPLVAWADRFRFEQEAGIAPPQSWVLTMLRRSHLIGWMKNAVSRFAKACGRIFAAKPVQHTRAPVRRGTATTNRWWPMLFYAVVIAGSVYGVWRAVQFAMGGISSREIPHVAILGFYTLIRVAVLIALASAVWVPIGVWVGLNPRAARIVQPVAQFLAAFPANLLFPVAVFAIVSGHLDADIWLSPLMILGTQWYILFNVVAGAAAIPGEMRDIASNLHVGGFLWWRRIGLPAIFPYYVTGAITASGGSWNAAIVAESVKWGDTKLQAHGLGTYIANATEAGYLHRLVLGIVAMSVFVTLVNRIFWRPLYDYAERKFRMG